MVIFLPLTGPVPVRPPHRYPVLPTAARPTAPRSCQRSRDTTLPQDYRGSGGPRPEEWGHPLLDTRETQVQRVGSGVDGGEGCSLGRETNRLGSASQECHCVSWNNGFVLVLKEKLGSRGTWKVTQCPQPGLCQGPQRQGVPGSSTLHP